ncbi:MAG TPA: trehalose-6-phosphate synthase [Nitrospiraceae bacterium]|jgi:trehalose 6-phosphate synthase|nr:trehalose-6-phosphate synthase [Nitrospiraceae bacterium]
MSVTEPVQPHRETLYGDSAVPLIVVSNREPYEHVIRKGHRVCERADGGLASALDPVLRVHPGIWVAWGSGEADREATGPDGRVPVPPDAPTYDLKRVWLTPEEVKGGYQGYSNEVLWPLCHVTLDRVSYRRQFWKAYTALNRRFADSVLEEFKRRPGLVWVHDFHLALLPGLIKQLSPNVPVAMFWHVPWPGPEIFRILPEHRQVLTALLQADSLVFQTPGSSRTFMDCARRLLEADADEGGRVISYKGHRTLVTTRPISVDFQSISEQAGTAQVEQAMGVVRRRVGYRTGMRFGLGVDRLDYTKGLLKRFWALDLFFTRYPQYRGVFSFIQIAVPTRKDMEAYRRYRKIIWQTVLDINERHGSDGDVRKGWHPILYLEDRVPLDLLVAYYRVADFAMVSSVNDGMNLVAKEYVAAQIDESGVLLISQMAGAAEELKDALIVNPYDSEGVADNIAAALEMSEEERRRRMRGMRAYVRTHDLQAWVKGCLEDAAAAERMKERA